MRRRQEAQDGRETHHVGLIGAALSAILFATPLEAQDAEALLSRHTALGQQLESNLFGRPLHVSSIAASGAQQGDVYARLEHSYDKVSTALLQMENWCKVLILPVNVKHCAITNTGATPVLTALISRRPHDPPEDAFRVRFRYAIAAADSGYLHVILNSPTGPLGTTDYHISLEAAPLDARRTFVHLSYSYRMGLAARIAMQAYLFTAGRDKVGFSVVGRLADGRPVHVDGLRGVIERNAMRYYLAIEAYLASLDRPPPQQLEQRLRNWWTAIERHPAQLQEALTLDEYLRMKRTEAGEHR